MEIYKDIDNDSGVASFEIDDDSITVKFKEANKLGHTTYKYSNRKAETNNIEQMKKLAILGDGLNAFINKNVRKEYDSRW